MRQYLVLLPIFFLALFQGAFLSLNLVLLLTLFLVTIKPARQSLMVAFLAGLFLDLAKGTPLGLSSLVFLFASGLLLLYRRKFDPAHPLFLLVAIFLVSNLYAKAAYGFFNWREGLILAILTFLLRPLIRYFSAGLDRHEIRLKV